ncbi:MAG: ferrous iron transport protein B [Puniceicoccales bacterium]|jgi:ferrous iron transport protein B|nr:ferrous iron transport protein B [Puniceicoccales bacterium]
MGKPRIALIGNPNTGKSTLFNALTGMRQRIGNYPGVTVAKKSGFLTLPNGVRTELLDLPGLYSLAAVSLDERVVSDVLCGRYLGTPAPDAVVCVVDIMNLRRNFFLASQVAEMGLPMMLVLNQGDVAQKRGMRVDVEKISRRLGGIPVVIASAWRGEGIHDVRAALVTLLEKRSRMNRIVWHPCVTSALETLRDGIAAASGKTDVKPILFSEAELQRLLFDAATVVSDRFCKVFPVGTVETLVGAAREGIRRAGFNPLAVEPLLHYERLHGILDGVVTTMSVESKGAQALDKVLLHRVFGTFIFFAMMVVVFSSVFWLAAIPQAWMEGFFEWLSDGVRPLLASTPVLQSLVVNGVIAGVGAFLGFLPQILTLFFFIALLEGSGYMARAAFLMDKLFSWCGLNGKSFVPMLSGYACVVPSVLATRTIEDTKVRLATIFILPLMSCSARLPVYTLMTGAFLVPRIGEVGGSLVMVSLYLIGLAIAIPTAWVLTRFFLKIRSQPFVLEMPRYQLPRPRDVLWRLWQSGTEFIRRAGTIIFAITVIIWALLYFPRDPATEEAARKTFVAEQISQNGKYTSAGAVEAALVTQDGDQQENPLAAELANRIEAAHIEASYLGQFGKFIQPLFAPAGFDWKITIGVLASFPAREVIVSTLGITHSLGNDVGGDALRDALAKSTWTDGPLVGKPVFTIPVVLGVMVFFALCSQCGATLAVIRKEIGLRWAVISFTYMTILAWAAATACYQFGAFFSG